MQLNELGGTGYDVTEVGLGTWNIGDDWGTTEDDRFQQAVHAALDAGMNLIDTADVYGDGRAEENIRTILSERPEDPYVITKAGRNLDPHVAEAYDLDHLERFVDGSRERLGVDILDLVQLHCPPPEAYYQRETFDALETLKDSGKIAAYGVSVQKVEEALKAVEYPGVDSVQIIFNPFRQRPAERFFDEALWRDVGVIVRVPLASGLLAGLVDLDALEPGDHRRQAAEGGVEAGVGDYGGETFAGVPYHAGVDAVRELDELVPDDVTLAQYSLRWILDHDAVTTVIPGSTNPEHVRENAAAADLHELSHREHGAIRDIYDEHVRAHVHHAW